MIDPADLEGLEDLAEVARSQQAIVYRAWQPTFHRHVAVAVLLDVPPDRFDDRRRSVGALAGHPNVATVHKVGVASSGLPFVVTDLLEGRSLVERLGTQGTVDWYEASQIAIRLAGVVEVARRAGIDVAIDPHGVVLSGTGEPVVTPVGFAPGDGLSSLQSILRLLVGSSSGVPPAIRNLVGGQEDVPSSPTDFAVRLRRAQSEAGRMCTELPLAVEVEPAPSAAAPDSATVVPLGPPRQPRSRRRRRRTVAIAAVLALVASTVALWTLRHDPDVSRRTASPDIGVPLYRDDFTAARGWKELDGAVIRRRFEDGQYRISVVGHEADRQAAAWAGDPPERRVTVALQAVFLSAERTHVGVACQAGPGGVLGVVSNDGKWAIQRYGGENIASGPPLRSRPEVGVPFTLELDCEADRAPTRITLWFNGIPVGEAQVQEPTGITTAGYVVHSASTTGTDVGLRSLEVRRLA